MLAGTYSDEPCCFPQPVFTLTSHGRSDDDSSRSTCWRLETFSRNVCHPWELSTDSCLMLVGLQWLGDYLPGLSPSDSVREASRELQPGGRRTVARYHFPTWVPAYYAASFDKSRGLSPMRWDPPDPPVALSHRLRKRSGRRQNPARARTSVTGGAQGNAKGIAAIGISQPSHYTRAVTLQASQYNIREVSMMWRLSSWP